MAAQPKHKYHYRRYLVEIGIIVAVVIALVELVNLVQLQNPNYLTKDLALYLDIAIMIIGGYLVIHIVSRVIVNYGRTELHYTHIILIKNLFQVAAVTALAVVILVALGANATSALVGAGFLGIILGLAAQTALGNIFAGLVLLFSKQFRVGDRITINVGLYGFVPRTYIHDDLIPGYTGIVKDIGLTHTKLVGDNNVPLSYPNSVLIQSMIFNHSHVRKRTVRITVDLDCDIPIDEFRIAIEKALFKDSLIDTTHPVIVNPIIVTEDKYNVVVEAWIKGAFEEPGKAVLVNKSIEVVRDFRKNAGAGVYEEFPLRIGDQVMFKGEYGTIEEVTPKFTIIKIWDNRRQVIPNSVLDTEVLVNYTLTDPSKLFPIVFSVTYNTDLDHAKEIIIEEAQSHPNVLKTLNPIFQVLDFTQGAITIRLLFLAKDQPTAFNTACDLRLAIKRRFDKAGIKLSCPATYITPDSKIQLDLTSNQNSAQ